jgi:alkaline phosphatase
MDEDMPFLRKTSFEFPVEESRVQQTCRLALATDSHYALKDDLGDKCYSDALLKMEEFVKTVNTLDCDFAIHLGDFKDEDLVPNEKSTLEYLRKMESEFSKFKGHRFHCLGNHDLDRITKKQFLEIAENSGNRVGEVEANFSNNSKSGHYSFDLNSLRFIVLDANFDEAGKDHFFRNGGDWEKPWIPPFELKWLKETLDNSPFPCILFIHHPVYAYVKNGHSYHVVNHMGVRAVLESSGKVLAVLNGHMHEEMFQEINGIRYLALNSMLEGTFVQRNCFYVLELDSDHLQIDRFDRINPLD